MDLFTKILVPVDFSEISLKGVQRAKAIALRCRSREIHLLFALDSSYAGLFVTSEMCLPVNYTISKANLKDAEAKMENLRSALQQETSLTVMGSVLEGNLSHVCKNYVSDSAIDLIIMATHGTGGIREFIFGSHAQDIISTVNCPVLSLQPFEEYNSIKKILLPVESFYPEKKLFFAIQLTKYFDAEIHLVSLIDKPDWLTNMTNSIIFRITEVLNRARINYKIFTSEKNNITDVVLAYAERESLDLILINPGKESRLTGKFIETTGGSIINHTRVPVLTIQRKQ